LVRRRGLCRRAAIYNAQALTVDIGHTSLENGNKRLTAQPFVIYPGRVSRSAGLFAKVDRDLVPSSMPAAGAPSPRLASPRLASTSRHSQARFRSGASVQNGFHVTNYRTYWAGATQAGLANAARAAAEARGRRSDLATTAGPHAVAGALLLLARTRHHCCAWALKRRAVRSRRSWCPRLLSLRNSERALAARARAR
jgi:hypothetical protein